METSIMELFKEQMKRMALLPKKHRLIWHILGLCSCLSPLRADDWLSQTIGTSSVNGSSSYDSSSDAFTIQGMGADIWSTADQFEYLYQPILGNSSITARIVGFQGVNSSAKAGVMIRENLTAESSNALVAVPANKSVVFQGRAATGGTSSGVTAGIVATPVWVRLERRGATLFGWSSQDGSEWSLLGSSPIGIRQQLYAGLVANGDDNTGSCTATFDQVSLSSDLSTVSIPEPWVSVDIGTPITAGIADGYFLPNSEEMAVQMVGAGTDIWGTADQLQYASRPLNGDGAVIAKILRQTDTDHWAKAGIMFRENLDADSSNVLLAVTPTDRVIFQWRSHTSGTTVASANSLPNIVLPLWMKLQRTGNMFTAWTSSDGASWNFVGSTTIAMIPVVRGGVAVTSHNTNLGSAACFSNVSMAVKQNLSESSSKANDSSDDYYSTSGWDNAADNVSSQSNSLQLTSKYSEISNISENDASPDSLPAKAKGKVYVDNKQGDDRWDGQTNILSQTQGPKKTLSAAIASLPNGGEIVLQGTNIDYEIERIDVSRGSITITPVGNVTIGKIQNK